MTQTQAARPAAKLHIRWMIRMDMPGVLECERAAFAPHWTPADFLDALRQRDVIGMVAEEEGRVVGYMVYRLLKSRLHLLRMAVAAEHRGRGIGRAMVARLTAKLVSHRRGWLSATVHERNVEAQMFLRAVGMACELSRVGDDGEDVYEFELSVHDEHHCGAGITPP